MIEDQEKDEYSPSSFEVTKDNICAIIDPQRENEIRSNSNDIEDEEFDC